MQVTLTEPGLAGDYTVAEQRDDGTLVLEPERERLSEVMAASDGRSSAMRSSSPTSSG